MWAVENVAVRERMTSHSDMVMLTPKYLAHLSTSVGLCLHVKCK